MKTRTKRTLRNLGKTKEPWYNEHIKTSSYSHPSFHTLFVVRLIGKRKEKFVKSFEDFLIDSKNSRKQKLTWYGARKLDDSWFYKSFSLTNRSKMDEAIDLLFKLNPKDLNLVYRSYHIIEDTIWYYKQEGAKEVYDYSIANLPQSVLNEADIYLKICKDAEPKIDLSLDCFKEKYHNIVNYCDQYRETTKMVHRKMAYGVSNA